MDLQQVKRILDELQHEKGISKESIVETIEMALAAAYKRDYGERGQIIRAKFDLEGGGTTFRQVKIIVDESMLKSDDEIAAEGEVEAPVEHERTRGRHVEHIEPVVGDDGEVRKVRFNSERHMMLAEAKKIRKNAAPGEEIEFSLEMKGDYGRIAAQTAKQVIIQRIREAERDAIWSEFKEKEGDIISGIVQRVEGRNVFVDLGRATAILPYEEQIPHERYRIGERVRALLLSTERGFRGPGLYLTRSHPQFVAKLFEMEVPEISQGAVDIKAIAREAGSRTKIAVASTEEGIDPVGSLVGQKGVRVGTVIAELGGEKIDIIEWSNNHEQFIAHALSPARVISVDLNETDHVAVVLVDESQLSLAIGRSGQNVRLAAKLSGWRIDIQGKEGEVEATSDDAMAAEITADTDSEVKEAADVDVVNTEDNSGTINE
ncbi:MAG: transcription termination factor NusA [Patescibacteria group bacterium]